MARLLGHGRLPQKTILFSQLSRNKICRILGHLFNSNPRIRLRIIKDESILVYQSVPHKIEESQEYGGNCLDIKKSIKEG